MVNLKVKKHYTDIKNKGKKEFLRKIKILIFRLINFFLIIFFAVPILFIAILISPFYLFRFGIIRSSRVGHFIANTELYLCKKKLKLDNTKLHFDVISYDSYGISNSFLEKNYKREINVYPNFMVKPITDLLNYFKNKNSFTQKFQINTLNAGGDRDIDGLLYKIQHSFKFDHKDISIIEKQLKHFNLDFSSKFICLNVRDEAYLNKTFPQGDWNYHNYRNWNIQNFIKASESLTKRGYKVIRMGKIVKEKMSTNNPMIIDYANSEYKSDLLDIYLHTKCFFTATTGTGIDLGSYVSRRPMAWIVVPVASFYSFKNNFFATKHHKHLDTKQKLTLSEIFEMGLANYGSKIESNNEIILEQLNDDEINSYLLEVLDILEGKFVWNEDDKKLQSEFWNKYKFLIDKYKLNHLHKNYEAIFSPIHLKNNPELLK